MAKQERSVFCLLVGWLVGMCENELQTKEKLAVGSLRLIVTLTMHVPTSNYNCIVRERFLLLLCFDSVFACHSIYAIVSMPMLDMYISMIFKSKKKRHAINSSF